VVQDVALGAHADVCFPIEYAAVYVVNGHLPAGFLIAANVADINPVDRQFTNAA
jgi:hypothetical protein